MANTVILGSELMIFATISGKSEAIACATSCKLDISASSLETSSKDSGKWTSKQASKLSWTASSDNLMVITEYKKLVDLMISRSEIELEFSTVANADSDNGLPQDGWESNNDGYKGKAIISSISLTASDGDNATYSVSFEGVGALQAITA
ncbi:MAG: phage tail protein [Muribaculaceae bacterium]|nr:phage tail protein [Muribaculaceae bacterium]